MHFKIDKYYFIVFHVKHNEIIFINFEVHYVSINSLVNILFTSFINSVPLLYAFNYNLLLLIIFIHVIFWILCIDIVEIAAICN